MLLPPPGPVACHARAESPLLDFVVVAADVATQEVVPALMGDVVADREDVGLMKGVAVYPTVVAGGELGGTCGDEGENRVLKVPKVWGCDDCPGVSVARELEGVPDVRRPAVRFDLAGAIAGEGAVAVVVAGGKGGAASSSVLPAATCRWASYYNINNYKNVAYHY
jgi:hypothetical protein